MATSAPVFPTTGPIRWLILAWAGLLLTWGGAAPAPAFEGPAPELRLPRVEGGELALSDYRGKLVVVNFWAPWCLPCREEMPDLQALHDNHADTVVIGLTIDYASREKVTRALEEMGIDYPVVLADTDDAAAFGDFRGLPTTFFISPEGEVVERHMGMMSKEQMQDYRQEILERGI